MYGEERERERDLSIYLSIHPSINPFFHLSIFPSFQFSNPIQSSAAIQCNPMLNKYITSYIDIYCVCARSVPC